MKIKNEKTKELVRELDEKVFSNLLTVCNEGYRTLDRYLTPEGWEFKDPLEAANYLADAYLEAIWSISLTRLKAKKIYLEREIDYE